MMWISVEGRVYLADAQQIQMMGMTMDEGLEAVILREKPPKSYPVFDIESYDKG